MSPPYERSLEDADRAGAEGGADSIQKTTYVTGEGTDPDEMTPPGVVARVSAGQGANPMLWTALAVAILVAVVYLIGIIG